MLNLVKIGNRKQVGAYKHLKFFFVQNKPSKMWYYINILVSCPHFPPHYMHRKMLFKQPRPLTYRSTWPADRSRMCEDTGRGRPFLSQLSWGGGEPVATHSMLTELSRTVINSSTVSLLPSMRGGTAGAHGEKDEKLTRPHNICGI